jgi:hypothetical protein
MMNVSTSFTDARVRDAGPKPFTYPSARAALDAAPSGIVVIDHGQFARVVYRGARRRGLDRAS